MWLRPSPSRASCGCAIRLRSGSPAQDVPLDSNEGTAGDDVLVVELPDDLDLTDIEIFLLSGMSGYRQWCIRAVSLLDPITAPIDDPALHAERH